MRSKFVLGSHDSKTLAQLEDVATRADRVALMADGHVGYIMPVGGVAAYRNQVSVAGVGFDIACGNAAILTDLRADQVVPHRNALADAIQSTISFGIGRTNKADDAPVNDPLFGDDRWAAFPKGVIVSQAQNKARSQLGTVGSGNHYVDVFADEQERVWVGVHFGSRGLGHGIASGFMSLARGDQWGQQGREIEALLPLDSEMGREYWALMGLAGRYAYVGREWVARKVVALLGGMELELVHNHHNFAWEEEHDGERFVVVRKGATPAFPGQKWFVGGSMGDNAVIIEGASDATVRAAQRLALYSTVHGAGRVMSRTEAKGKVARRTGRIIKPGRVSPEMMESWLRLADVVLRGGGLDESPHAYRRLGEVLKAQGPTINILHHLRPLIVVMAGADEFDPYKD